LMYGNVTLEFVKEALRILEDNFDKIKVK